MCETRGLSERKHNKDNNLWHFYKCSNASHTLFSSLHPIRETCDILRTVSIMQGTRVSSGESRGSKLWKIWDLTNNYILVLSVGMQVQNDGICVMIPWCLSSFCHHCDLLQIPLDMWARCTRVPVKFIIVMRLNSCWFSHWGIDFREKVEASVKCTRPNKNTLTS